jgi:hypothetical protein
VWGGKSFLESRVRKVGIISRKMDKENCVLCSGEVGVKWV